MDSEPEKKTEVTKKKVKVHGQKITLALIMFISALVLAIVSISIQSWAVQDTDRFESRMGLIQRCHRLKVPAVDEECHSAVSMDCQNPDYVSQSGQEKQSHCLDAKQTIQTCLALMLVALISLLAATVLCLPGPLRKTAIATVCGFISGILLLVVVLLFRYFPQRDFAFTYFEGSACNGLSFGLAVGATFMAWFGSFVSAVVTVQQKRQRKNKARDHETTSSTDSWKKEDDMHMLQVPSRPGLTARSPTTAGQPQNWQSMVNLSPATATTTIL